MFFPTANWYMSVPSSSAHAPRSIEIEPNNFATVLPLMRTPGSSSLNVPRWPSARCAGAWRPGASPTRRRQLRSPKFIVVGNRGLGAPEGHELGSVPAEVVRRANSDVLIVQILEEAESEFT